MQVCMYICADACSYVCMYVCMYVLYIYTYIFLGTSLVYECLPMHTCLLSTYYNHKLWLKLRNTDEWHVREVSTPTSYFGGPGLIYRPTYWLSWYFFVIFIIP
jgi:hypothetical protein